MLPEQLDQLGQPVQMDQLDHKELLDQLDLRGHKAYKEQRVQLVLPELELE